MALITIKGNAKVVDADFKTVKWTGRTKAGDPVEITLSNAINMGNVDLTFAEKDDVVAQVVYTAAYNNTDTMITDEVEEPWQIKYTQGTDVSASGEILLGAGIVSINGTDVALTRGGSSFSIEREFREINADGDLGAVKGRVTIDGSRATLTLNALQVLTRMADFYAGITVS